MYPREDPKIGSSDDATLLPSDGKIWTLPQHQTTTAAIIATSLVLLLYYYYCYYYYYYYYFYYYYYHYYYYYYYYYYHYFYSIHSLYSALHQLVKSGTVCVCVDVEFRERGRGC